MAAMDPTARLLALCQATGASAYLSGPSARGYLDEARFNEAGIRVAWMDYAGYPEYPQLWGPFAPAVSIVDLLLNAGASAPSYLIPRGETPADSQTQAFAGRDDQGPSRTDIVQS
jgi:hypothetical protein